MNAFFSDYEWPRERIDWLLVIVLNFDDSYSDK